MSVMDINEIRRKFPILDRKVEGRNLVYLDNTATSQTPHSVVSDISSLYEHTKANVHRGVHTLSQEATDLQERTREHVRRYINASSIEEVVFTRGTTEAINLVASSFGDRLRDGDEIVLTVMEHHANIVPWQLLQRHKDIRLRVVDIDSEGTLDLGQYRSLFREMTAFAKERGVPVLIDGAQASPHMKIDVRDLDCDFYAFSSHKMYGPTGVGVLYGRRELLESMPPYQGGGEMIKHVSFSGTTFADLPFKFEAGTPDFIDIAAFSKALDFIEETGIDNIAAHEEKLLAYATERLERIPGLRIFGKAPHKSAVISFLVGDIHPYDLGMLLDKLGVAVRTGHHCAMPLMERFGIPGTVRASFAVYNTFEEVDAFVAALERVVSMF